MLKTCHKHMSFFKNFVVIDPLNGAKHFHCSYLTFTSVVLKRFSITSDAKDLSQIYVFFKNFVVIDPLNGAKRFHCSSLTFTSVVLKRFSITSDAKDLSQTYVFF